ncbi:MAG: LuxR family transcriptional regulator [Hymenobacter sp.]|nr:MAG: LuxR family transcriptional regulator [Hymenobacter sp.]
MTNTDLLIAAKVREIAATADAYPGVVIIANLQADRVEYMSSMGLQALGISLPELRAMGAQYHERFFNPQEAHEFVPKMYELMQQNDLTQTISFFQQVRTGPAQTFEWYLTATRLLLRDTAGQPLLILSTAHSIDPKHHLTHKVQRLLDENVFLRTNHGRFATLTTREREVLRALALGQSAPEIASHLFISPQTAETHRRNLRRKLGAESAFELGQYARAFDLI